MWIFIGFYLWLFLQGLLLFNVIVDGNLDLEQDENSRNVHI